MHRSTPQQNDGDGSDAGLSNDDKLKAKQSSSAFRTFLAVAIEMSVTAGFLNACWYTSLGNDMATEVPWLYVFFVGCAFVICLVLGSELETNQCVPLHVAMATFAVTILSLVGGYLDSRWESATFRDSVTYSAGVVVCLTILYAVPGAVRIPRTFTALFLFLGGCFLYWWYERLHDDRQWTWDKITDVFWVMFPFLFAGNMGLFCMWMINQLVHRLDADGNMKWPPRQAVLASLWVFPEGAMGMFGLLAMAAMYVWPAKRLCCLPS